MKSFSRIIRWTAAGLTALAMSPAFAQQKEVTIAYQQIDEPWIVGIANGSIEKATGYKINWRQFESGAKVAAAKAYQNDAPIHTPPWSPCAGSRPGL